tara:strand:+ start:309 stop:467 length:159 start_codon:yes stop_codon:yes gene_type:complete
MAIIIFFIFLKFGIKQRGGRPGFHQLFALQPPLSFGVLLLFFLESGNLTQQP